MSIPDLTGKDKPKFRGIHRIRDSVTTKAWEMLLAETLGPLGLAYRVRYQGHQYPSIVVPVRLWYWVGKRCYRKRNLPSIPSLVAEYIMLNGQP